MPRSLADAAAVVAAVLVPCWACVWAAPGALDEGLRGGVRGVPLALCVGTGAAAMLLVSLALRRGRKRAGAGAASDGSRPRAAPTGLRGRGDCCGPGTPESEPIRWSFVPSTGVFQANMDHPISFENELASLKGIAMHRPTHAPAREASGNYPYSWHFCGKKRVWEVRVQMRFKSLPQGPLYFGVETRYVPFEMSVTVKSFKNMVVRAMQTIGGDLYQSSGDNPATTVGEAESPCCVFPLWAIDQFHVCDPGEEPDITGDLEGYGMRRNDGMKAYIRSLKETLENLSTEKVYTFSIWGVSPYLDAIHWEFRGLWRGFKLDANRVAGSPPLYIVMYDMPGYDPCGADQRHLASLKRYYIKVAMWSTIRPVDEESLRSIGVDTKAADGEVPGQRHERHNGGGKLARWLSNAVDVFSCCSPDARFCRSASPGADGSLQGGSSQTPRRPWPARGAR
ncbi:unnamed protein product [Prorocentrum cordatum]|uniref:Domain of unknown function at the cortex 1 domain-containing protein n=1 Tax=Prorocentrum cordatum TaxID=2364126 RepID=A0ABN9Q8T9_9DINO|nr:unnamed protein product [Polarella glacialis]